MPDASRSGYRLLYQSIDGVGMSYMCVSLRHCIAIALAMRLVSTFCPFPPFPLPMIPASTPSAAAYPDERSMYEDDHTTSGCPPAVTFPSEVTAPVKPCIIRSNPGMSARGPFRPYAVMSTYTSAGFIRESES